MSALSSSSALIVVDIQNDFLPGGALAIAGSDTIIPTVNRLMPLFDHVVLTQDWHPINHISFATNHPGKDHFETIATPYGPQTLWPLHCVSGTSGAAFAGALDSHRAHLIIRKGYHRHIDSYSGFVDQDGKTRTGLTGWLREVGVGSVVVCGLATDFCVAATAIDGSRAGFDVVVVTDASKAIDVNGSLADAERRMVDAGVRLITVEAVFQAFDRRRD